MAELKDYKNSDFSLTVNNRMHGIELRFAKKMSEEQIASIKDAGFKWSKRQQMWYSYQNEKSIAYAESLVSYYKNTMSAKEFNQKVEEELSKIEENNINKSEPEIIPLEPLKILSVEQVENPIEVITVDELADLVRQRAELDRRIAEIKEVINIDGKKVDVSSEQAREFVLDMNETQNVSESTNKNQIEEKSSKIKQIELSIDDLETAKKFIPEMEYSTLLDNATHGEEAEYFKQKIKHVADMGHILYENRDGKSYNSETKLHDKGFIHYFIGSSDWYVCEVDEDNVGFGFAILNGDIQNAEYGYIDLNEVTTLTLNGFIQTELDIYNDDSISMEHAIVEKYPELKEELLENEQKIENDSDYAVELADWIIQHCLESSVSQENLTISYDVILEYTNTPKEWLYNPKNIELVNEALAAHNDNELLDYNPLENEEGKFTLYFCSNADENNGENTLFKKDDFGRWVRKSEEELLKENVQNKEVLIEAENSEMMSPDESIAWNEEEEMQHSQDKELDELAESKAFALEFAKDIEQKYSYFVKDTAEFEQFADFEPITNLSANEAIEKMLEQERKGLSAGIGIYIPDDFVFNDPDGMGAIIFNKIEDTYSFYMGDSFVKELKENNEHAYNVITAFKELDEAIKGLNLNNYKEPAFLYEKETELFAKYLEDDRNEQLGYTGNEGLFSQQEESLNITLNESPFDRVTKHYSEKYKDFYSTYEQIKEKHLENETRYIGDARIRSSFEQVHDELVKLQIQEVNDIIKESESLEEAKQNAIRYFNFNGNDGLTTNNLYFATKIGSYNQGMFSTSAERLHEYIKNKFNDTHNIESDGQLLSEQKDVSKTADQSTSKKDIKAIREQCREILKKSDKEITEADKVILALYEGAGGLNEANRSNAGILNEFYTPNNLVEKVWQIVDAYAPDAKTVLEPSAGVGKFANNRPNNEFTMHELDETSARINKILHPEANVIHGAFQKQFFDEGERFKRVDFVQPKYDVVIGNPPYGVYNDKYKGLGEGKEFDRYEEYFISKGLDALKNENSVMAYVVPSGFLNTANDKQKEIIGSKGILIDAYRLPVGVFPTTDVGTDILVMKPWTWNEAEAVSRVEMAKIYAEEMSNNDWFKKHPEKILGQVKTRTNRFGKEEEYVTVHEGLTVQDELNKIYSLLPKIQVHIEKDNNKIGQSLEASEKSINNILRTPKTYPYINDDGSLNPDRLNEGDIIIDKDDGIPYKAHMIFGNQYVRVTSVSMKKENTSLFEELEEKRKSDEHSFELGAGWKDVLNDRFSAPSKEQLENWKYPSWYQKHLDEQEEYESQRDYIRQPVLKILEESKNGKTYNKDELTHIYAETLAKELDFICHHNDIAFEERINPATGEKMKFSTDEYGYARIKHEIPEICDFYGADFVKSIIYNTAIHFIDETKEDTYLRLQKQYPDFFSEKTENLSILKSIKDISCTEEYVGTKEHGNSIWDLTREYINNVKDKSIDENHNLENVFKHNNLSLSSDAIKITDTAKLLNTDLPLIKNNKQKENSSLKNNSAEKSPVMSAEEFSRLYGRDFDEKEFPIWRATDWEGIIDRTKLNFEEENLLHTSQNYVEIEPGQFTHKVLFESGDITAKIENYKNKISFLNQNEDKNKIALYQKNIQQLESVSLPKIPIERIHFGVNSTLAEEFTIEHINSDGEIEKLNLQESFILWAKGMTWADATGSGYYWRGGIDYATANISEEDMPQNVSWYDIVEYIDRKSVKADRVSTWRKSDEEINADKAQKRKEAEEKRMARSETADRLFDKYLHEGLSPELSAKVEAEYNRRFNSYIIPDYSKLPLFIDGMSREKDGKKFKLYDQQIKGVSFLCNKGNGLLAYDVGVGKTAAGIVATVNQIQTGRCKRPIIVVPNAVYAKWYKDIQDLFPNIKVNDLYNLNKESSSKYRNAENPHKLDIPENSISLVTYEALKNITFTDESCENELLDDYSKLLSEDFDGSDRENAGAKEKIKGVIGVASQVKNTNYVFFEDCGFDNITVDEAHNFKNLWTVPKPKNKGESNEFSGIPSSRPSARALKLFAMTQLTQRHNEDRNVFLLTATPFTNSPLEVYSMLSYVGRKRLVDSGIYSLRDFCTEFAHTKLELGVNAKGEIDQKQVMKDWKELPALQKILTEFIDKVDGEELKEIIRPKKFTHVQEIEMSDLQKQMMQIDTDKMSEVKEGNSAAVIVSMNAMRVGLVAPALADPARYPGLELPSMEKLVETSPKLKFVCDSVIGMYKNNPEKGQFIYMPLGQTAHGIVKDYLVAHGLPKEAVEIINGSVNNTTDKKAKVTEKFNDSKNKCKILIGGKNTSEGIDLNGNSFVMYNCSLGWNPSETIQAEGRIWRQGNQQGHVHCVYPVMNDSIDSLLYQKHDEKRSRINEIWTYKAGDTLNVEDINPEELKFELIKDPQKRAKLILENGIDTPEYKFTGTKHIQNELNKVNSRIKSFEETDEKRKNLVENLKGAEIKIQNRLKNIEDYKSRELEVPEWCKMELKEERKYKESYEHQLETINRKFSSWGIKDDKDIEEFIPRMNAQKHSLEKELEEKKKELPKILAKENLKMQEKKILLPPVSEQLKQLTEDIQKNLRPMTEVEPEVRTLRFKQMLEQKWEKGELTNDEKDFYSSIGYKRYYEWLDGEIENFDVPLQKQDVDVTSNQEVKVQTENEQNQSETTVEKETFDNGGLFSDQALAELEQINKDLIPKVHQLITYTEDSGIDEKLEYPTLSEAQKEGKQFLKEWELDESENGFVVFNKETKQIESSFGYFPVEEAFSKDILLANGYKTFVAKGQFVESSVSEISNAVKERLNEQNISTKHIDSHISFTGVKPNVNENTVNGYCD